MTAQDHHIAWYSHTMMTLHNLIHSSVVVEYRKRPKKAVKEVESYGRRLLKGQQIECREVQRKKMRRMMRKKMRKKKRMRMECVNVSLTAGNCEGRRSESENYNESPKRG